MKRQKKLLDRIRSFFISASIIRTIKTSHIVIIALLLVPLMVSIVITLLNTISYDRLITNVDKTNKLIQIVKIDISAELWDVVAGNKSFDEGSQYQIIGDIHNQIEDILASTEEIQNRRLLEVADRSMNTLIRYGYSVDKIIQAIRTRA